MLEQVRKLEAFLKRKVVNLNKGTGDDNPSKSIGSSSIQMTWRTGALNLNQ
jgi:hypothetical protein